MEHHDNRGLQWAIIFAGIQLYPELAAKMLRAIVFWFLVLALCFIGVLIWGHHLEQHEDWCTSQAYAWNMNVPAGKDINDNPYYGGAEGC